MPVHVRSNASGNPSFCFTRFRNSVFLTPFPHTFLGEVVCVIEICDNCFVFVSLPVSPDGSYVPARIPSGHTRSTINRVLAYIHIQQVPIFAGLIFLPHPKKHDGLDTFFPVRPFTSWSPSSRCNGHDISRQTSCILINTRLRQQVFDFHREPWVERHCNEGHCHLCYVTLCKVPSSINMPKLRHQHESLQ